MASFVNFCAENGFSGAEKFAGLPGTLGGALFMNARCFDLSISELFVEAYYIDLNDYTEQHKIFSSSDWDYKVSPFQNSHTLILSATFRLKKNVKSKEELKSENKKYIEERKSKGHFNFPSAGSVFRNNREFGAPSGKIIDECGLRGKQIGMAQIAPFHGNFIINLGGATQKDVKALVEFTVKEVKAKTGFCLQPEIIFVDK
jgi:UDP-N-acetylmuramate dehydrogenase